MPKKIAYSTGMTIKDRTAANDSPNMMHTAIAPKNGSVSSGMHPEYRREHDHAHRPHLADAPVEDRLIGRFPLLDLGANLAQDDDLILDLLAAQGEHAQQGHEAERLAGEQQPGRHADDRQRHRSARPASVVRMELNRHTTMNTINTSTSGQRLGQGGAGLLRILVLTAPFE